MVLFTKGVVTIALQNPEVNDLCAIRKKQAIQERADGGYYRYALADGSVREVELRWSELRRSERDNLANFYDLLARGVLETFTYTDEQGVAWSAHFLNTELEFTTAADTKASSTTFVSGGASYPTTVRSGGVYAATIRLRLW